MLQLFFKHMFDDVKATSVYYEFLVFGSNILVKTLSCWMHHVAKFSHLTNNALQQTLPMLELLAAD